MLYVHEVNATVTFSFPQSETKWKKFINLFHFYDKVIYSITAKWKIYLLYLNLIYIFFHDAKMQNAFNCTQRSMLQ